MISTSLIQDLTIPQKLTSLDEKEMKELKRY